MIKAIEKMTHAAASSARLAITLLAVCSLGSAWAVTANVVWENDFGTTQKTGLDGKTYTLALPDASWLQEDGTIKIGSNDKSQGATITVTGGVSGEKVSILMEYAGATAQSAVVPVYVDAGAWLGSQTKDSSLEVTGHWWNNGGVAYPTSGDTITTMPEAGYFMYIFAQGSNVEIYSAETLSGMSDASAGGAVSGLNTANRIVRQIALGGVMIGGNGAGLTSRPISEFTDLVIKRVAIFTSQISASEAAAYKFPSEGTKVTVTEANTSWETAFPSWDDSADNSDKTLFVEIQEGASLSKDTALSVNGLFVTGAGSLTLSGAVTASSGITIGSGATVSISANTGSAITNYGTLNVNGCTVSGAIYNKGTVNTDGTVSLSSGSNTFYYGSTLKVKTGTTTLSTSNQGLKGDIYILADAVLVNGTSDSLTYYASSSEPTHAYIYGTLTMNQKWTVAQSNYIHLYSGATLNGSANLHFNKNTGTVIVEEDGDYTIGAPFNTDNGTAKVEVKGSATLTLSSTPNNLKIEKAGTGTLKWSNKVLGALSGTGGTIEIEAGSSNLGHTFTSSTYNGVLKLTGTSKQNNLVGSGSTRCFADGVRPELIADAMETYLSKAAYNEQTLYVRNLSGRSGAKLDARYTGGPISYTIDTLQERDTEYLGIFNNNNGDDRTFALNVTGDNVGGIHTLTLGGDNASTNTLTVSNYAKVKFSSTGKWANGIVVVGENGVLESQNSAAIAAKLKVEEGATLKFASGVQLAATAYDWSAVSNDGSVNVDLSDIAPSDTPVTLIASGVGVAVGKFAVTGAKSAASLSIDNGALKVTFANVWEDGTWYGDIESNGDATLYISQNSTLTVSEALSLGAVTVVNESEGNVTLTISGAGALTTGGWTIPEGVTVNTPASMTISGTVSGDGVLNVPANNTLAIGDGTCSVAITANTSSTLNFTDCTINGGVTAPQNYNVTINTYGDVTFGSSANNDFQYSTTFNVESGTTTYNSKDDCKLWCDINVKSGATLINGRGDSFNWGAQSDYPIHAYIWGTLTMNAKWTVGAGNQVHLYDGALIDGTVDDALHFNTGTGKVIAEEGDSVITAPFVKGGGTISVEVKAGATLSTKDTPAIATKTGEGLLLKRIADNTRWGGGTVSANYDGVDLYSSDSHTSNDNEIFLNSSFAGYLKITTEGGDYRSFAWVAAGSFSNPVFSGRPTLELAGDMRIYQATADKPFTVKNLSGVGDIYNFNDADNKTFKYIDTLQTQATTYSGKVKNISSCSDCDPSLTVRGADDATSIYSLTLSGVSDTTAPLTITNNAKVVFSSTGKWSGGTVAVCKDGVLESQNSAAIAAILRVQKGAKLKFADGVQLAATTYDWSDVSGELENSEKIMVDLGSVTPASEVTLIASGVTIDAGKFTVTASKYGAEPTLSIVDGALKATYSGNLCVDGTWLVGPTANQEATIFLNESSTLTTASDLTLGLITVYNTSGTPFTLTTAGAGELTLGGINAPYSEVTLNVGSKVTLTGTLAGTSKINVLDGGELTIDGVTCDKKITVQNGGKLYTKGTTTLSSSANVFYYGSEFEVVDGTTTLTTASAGLKGAITIDGDATLAVGANGGINSSATASEPTELHVYGSLDMSTYRWVFGANNAMYFYTGCSFTGTGPDTYGPWEINGSSMYVKPNGEETGTVTVPLRTVYRSNTPVDVAANMNLTISGYLAAGWDTDKVGFTKTGDGDFALTPSGFNGAIPFVATTVSAGRMIMERMPMFPSVVIEDGATFTLQNAAYTADKFSGTGTLELLKTTSGNINHTATSTFSGTLKVTRNTGAGHHAFGSDSASASSGANLILTGSPSLEIGGTAAYMCLSGEMAGNCLAVANLTGSGTIDPVYTATTGTKTIRSKQTDNTAFSGVFSGTSPSSRDSALYVYGEDSTVKSLTLSGVNTTCGPLTVDTYGKVVFTSGGSWRNGTVTVGANGYLESTNTMAITKLALEDEANIVFPTSSSCLSELTSITFASGTVTISYPSGVTPTSGTKLINWSSAPAGSFVFDNDSTIKQFGGDYYMLEPESTGLYVRKAVAVDNLASPKFYSSVEGALDENNAVYLIAAPDEHVMLPVGKTISNPMSKDVSNLTVNPTTAEYAVTYANNSYTVASTAVTYYWAGAAGGDWGTRSNWKVAAADGPVATRDMESTDSVAFNNGAIVALGATRRVAGIAVEGTVYISAVDAGSKSLETTGNITGTGTLTLVDVTLANVATTALTVAPSVNFTTDSELAATEGYGFTFNGAVGISDTIKVWNVNHTVAGTTTLNGNFTKAGGFGLILGDVTVSANTTPTISNGSITINGEVTVADGATFTLPASGLTVGNSASFVLSGKSSVLVDNGSGASGKVSTSLTDGAKVISSTSAGVTTYRVVYGTIFSVY